MGRHSQVSGRVLLRYKVDDARAHDAMSGSIAYAKWVSSFPRDRTAPIIKDSSFDGTLRSVLSQMSFH